MGEDKIIIETKGKRFEIPLHIAKIELHKDWRNGEEVPELVIRAIGTSKEEADMWGEIYGLVCRGK